jgi:hypothetical protein
MDEEIRWYKGPRSLALSEHWNYTDEGKDFFGGYVYTSQGPLPLLWATTLAGDRGLWGQALKRGMAEYNHQVGLKMVGEMMPQERNRVTLAEETDQYGLPIARDPLHDSSVAGGERARHLGPDGRHLPSQRDRENGRRSAHQRRRRGLQKLGCPQPVDL